MKLAKPRLAALALAVVVAAGGAALVFTMLQPGGQQQAAKGGAPGGPPGGQRGPGGPGGGGPGGRGGPVDVVAVPTSARTFISRIEALGTLEPRERVVLTANAADRVTGLFFEDGQRVKRGKTLLTLVNEEERAQLDSANATAANAKLVYERNQRLAADQAIAELELERSKTAYESAAANVAAVQARLRDRVMLAPFDGILGFRQVSLGAYVSPGQAVATLIDDSEMRLEFGVGSNFIQDLSTGLAIEASTVDIPGRVFTGALTSIDNAIDPVTRSVKVRATLPNNEGLLKAGMFMTVGLTSRERVSLAAPEISVVAEGSKTFVYVADASAEPAVAKKVEITIGARERGSVEVLTGLQSGDLVVTDGVLKLRPGAPVRVRGQAAPEQMNQPLAGAGDARLAAGAGPSDKAGLRQ